MKKKKNKVFLIIFVAVFVPLAIIFSIYKLTNRDKVQTVKIGYATEVVEVVHLQFLVIPVGRDHYYLGLEAETGDAYIIKAGKNWLRKNFNSDKTSKAPEGAPVEGRLERIGNYKVVNDLRSRSESIGFDYTVGPDHCLDVMYKRSAVLTLLLAALVAGVAIFALVCVIIAKKKAIPAAQYRVILEDEQEFDRMAEELEEGKKKYTPGNSDNSRG